MTDTPALYRVVDARNQGWHPVGGDDRYHADYGRSRGLDPMTLDEISATRGPWRPVEPITDDDEQNLTGIFRTCARRTVTTIAAALEVVYHEVREAHGGLSNPDSYEYARRTLLAGREGSWESELLFDIVLFGNDLNLLRAKQAHNVDNSAEAMRARGPHKRVDRAGRDALADVFRRWVTDPARYTEVAETLASVVSGYADDNFDADGWAKIADQWLQPEGLARHDFSLCYRLLYSQSVHFNTNLI